MTTYARIDNGVVQEILTLPDNLDINSVVPPDHLASFVVCDSTVREFWTYTGGAFAAPPAPAISKDDLTIYAQQERYAKEVGGVIVNNMPVATDDRSKLMIIGASVAASQNANFATSWVGSDGATYALNATQVLAMSAAVQTHVAACFSTFASLKQGIDAGTITTKAQVDAAFAAVT